MTNKTLYKAQWLWQDYTGAKWQNLSWANTGDDHASYVYPQGRNSKSSYKPKERQPDGKNAESRANKMSADDIIAASNRGKKK